MTMRLTEVLRPTSVAAVGGHGGQPEEVKPLGTRHCFNDIADFPGGVQIDVSGIDCPMEIDEDARHGHRRRRDPVR